MNTPGLWLIFLTFLKLGLTSFGGPAAHLHYFRQQLVQQKKWLSDEDYNHLVALTQLLPGPSSSQVGIAIGFIKQGYSGSIIAWIGFTLPSAILMICLGILDFHFLKLLQTPQSMAALQTIILSVITFAFWQMFKSFCKTTWQYGLTLFSCLFILLLSFKMNQFFIICISGLIGWLIYKLQNQNYNSPNIKIDPPKSKAGLIWFAIFLIFFVMFFLLKTFYSNVFMHSMYSFYSTGSMVFGGGHVVLPLLHQEFVNTHLIQAHIFEMGYAFAQLMPGPLFTFASYLGTQIPMTSSPIFNGLLATLLIFLPSFFLIFACIKYWSNITQNLKIQYIVNAINAAVVGLLLATIIPMGMHSLNHFIDFACFILLFILLRFNVSIFIGFPIIFFIYSFL